MTGPYRALHVPYLWRAFLVLNPGRSNVSVVVVENSMQRLNRMIFKTLANCKACTFRTWYGCIHVLLMYDALQTVIFFSVLKQKCCVTRE